MSIDSLAPAENEVEAHLTWKPGSTRVVAKDDTGKPIPAGVGFIGDSDVPAVVLGPDGDEIFTLPPGNWTVLVSAEGYGVEKEDILISPDSESLVVVSLTMKEAEVEVTHEEVRILQRILFEVDGDKVSAGSGGLVEEVAATLLANPHIRKVEVQGHTDNTGKASYNLDLSQRRVDAVMQMLIDQGVEADRLVAKGYGQTQPIADNSTDEGREQNRRVQFVILEQDE